MINKCMYNDFYVYAFYYPDTDIIFYVGKGRKSRIDVSARLTKTPKDKNYYKFNALKSIYDAGKFPNKKKLLTNVSETAALEYETKLINQYGRLCDNSGILTNIATNSALGNTGWVPSKETRDIWSQQRKNIRQSANHVAERVKQIKGKHRSNSQKYNCIISKLNADEQLTENYKTILLLFSKGLFIEKIHKATGVDKEIISKIITYNELYTAAVNNLPFKDEFYNSSLKWSCQKISHILKDKKFYTIALSYIDNIPGISIKELCEKLNSNATRIRFIIKNNNDIKGIIHTYD
jgi:hypothetical protein